MVRRIAAVCLVACLVVGCGGRSSHSGPPPGVVPAVLTIENEEIDDLDIFLDFEFVGRVPAQSIVTFEVTPGNYELEIDVVGDLDGPVHFTNVSLQSGVEVIVNFSFSLLGLLIDIIFS